GPLVHRAAPGRERVLGDDRRGLRRGARAPRALGLRDGVDAVEHGRRDRGGLRARAVSRRRLRVAWRRVAPVVLPILAFVLFTAIWEVWVRVGDVSRFILPPPSTIAQNLNLFDQLWPDLWATMERVIYGFLLAVGVGFVLSVGIVTFKPLGRALMPL